MRKLLLLAIVLSTIISNCFADIERRSAIDVGSGGTKIAIADVDTDTHEIIDILLETSFPVPYQTALDKSYDGTFDRETMDQGIKVFKEIQELLIEYEVKKTVAIATSAFRKSNNGHAFALEIQNETGIPLEIIPQRKEGEIAYYSALAIGGFDSQAAIVWDIGTGSLQITTAGDSENLIVYMGEQMGSVAFKNYVIAAVQENDVEDTESPNPINEEDWRLADSYARAFARKATPLIKEKIKNNAPILGIGRLFYHSIRPIAKNPDVITRNDLRNYINTSLNKSDEELNNPYANVDVTNCILTLAVMKALHIQEIRPIDTTSTKGLLIMEETL